MKKSQNYWLCSKHSLLKVIKIMRLTIFIILFSITQTFATSSYSQNTKLSLNLKKVSLEKVLDEIENNTEFYFLYNRKLVDVDRVVDIELNGQTIEKVQPQEL